MVLGKMPPGKVPPGKLSPGKLLPPSLPKKSILEYLSGENFVNFNFCQS